MTKKGDLIDLKPEKVTEEQLKKIQDQVSRMNNFQIEVGMVETRKHALLHQIGSIQQEISTTQEELKKEYGSADINIQTGEIKYSENGEANKED